MAKNTLVEINRKELKLASQAMYMNEALMLIKNYYTIQKTRIAFNNQNAALLKNNGRESHTLWFMHNRFQELEDDVKKQIEYFIKAHPLGVWPLMQTGIGPVLAASMVAYINPWIAKYASNVWSYAGIATEKQAGRVKGQKLTHNPNLKKTYFLIGDSLLKQTTGIADDPFTAKPRHENAFYAGVLIEHLREQIKRNEDGRNAAAAKHILETKTFKEATKKTEMYQNLLNGKLPKAQLLMRARRYAVKLLFAHYHTVAHKIIFGRAPSPYILSQENNMHTQYIPPFREEDLPELMNKAKFNYPLLDSERENLRLQYKNLHLVDPDKVKLPENSKGVNLLEEGEELPEDLDE